MSPETPDDLLLEATLSPQRARDADGLLQAPPEWWDLSPENRVRAFEAQLQARRIESAVDARGWSGTVHAVLQRIRGI